VQMTLRDFNVANENIDRTIEVVEDILLQFDIARRVTCSFPFCCYKFEWSSALIPPFLTVEVAK
jgi:hypothetical protein